MAVDAGIRVVDGASVVLGAVALVVDGATVTAVVRTFEELAAGTTVATTIGADVVVGPSTELFDPDRPKMKAPTAAATTSAPTIRTPTARSNTPRGGRRLASRTEATAPVMGTSPVGSSQLAIRADLPHEPDGQP